MSFVDRFISSATLLSRQVRQLQRDYLPRLPDFVQLARFDKPIGIYLLLWPTLWGLWFAAQGWPGFHLLFVFVMGVILMRSAGCVINDVADRNFDGQVKRTLERPLITHKITVQEALLFCAVLSFLAFLLVLTTNKLTILLSFAAVAIAMCYPFMKRHTYLPQVVLGAAFSWGIPMSFAAYSMEVPKLAWLIFTATVVWTVAYDTQYAMVDRDDDIKLGLKSTAILFGDLDRLMIGILQFIFIVTLWTANQLTPLGFWFHLGLAAAVVLLIYQQVLIRKRKREECFRAFLNNHWVGLMIFSGLLLEFSFK